MLSKQKLRYFERLQRELLAGQTFKALGVTA